MTTHKLPDGKITRSWRTYVDTWREFGRTVAKAFGGHCVAFDPDLLVVVGKNSVNLGLLEAWVIYNQVKEIEHLREKLSEHLTGSWRESKKTA